MSRSLLAEIGKAALKNPKDLLTDLDPRVERVFGHRVEPPENVVNGVVTGWLTRAIHRPQTTHAPAGLALVETADRRVRAGLVAVVAPVAVLAVEAVLAAFLGDALVALVALVDFLADVVIEVALAAPFIDGAPLLVRLAESAFLVVVLVVVVVLLTGPAIEDAARSLATSVRSRVASAWASSSLSADTSPRRVTATSTSLRTRAVRLE